MALVAPETWARIWDEGGARRPSPLWTHDDVTREVERLIATAPGLVSHEVVGRSVEGRALHALRIGRGGFGVLLWSQMHGDEPSATPALFDVLDYLLRQPADPVSALVLDNLTLHVVPMLNPDGAQRFERRNAQGLDVNRDALRLQSPEGRALKALRDRVEPRIGFNLHNQNWRTSVGRPPHPASVSLLSVAYDEARSENEGRRLTKRVAAVIRDALEPMAAGRIGRYDDEFEARAFGDNLTKWGTPIVLIESGPWPGADADLVLTKLNFVALMTSLEALASGRVHDIDPARYERLPLNEGMLVHTLITNATIAPGTGVPPFAGDVAIAATRVVRDGPDGRRIDFVGRIEDIGDLRVYGALETIDATGKWLAPLPQAPVAEGEEVSLPVPGRGAGPVILPGQPGALMVLTPVAEAGRYRVDRIVRFAPE
jgi:hypothetical protein